MIHLLIKGGISIAEAELAKRGIPTYDKTWTSASDLGGLVTHTAVPEVYWDKVARWFGEDAKVPFPSGTLLFFTKGNGTAERKTA